MQLSSIPRMLKRSPIISSSKQQRCGRKLLHSTSASPQQSKT